MSQRENISEYTSVDGDLSSTTKQRNTNHFLNERLLSLKSTEKRWMTRVRAKNFHVYTIPPILTPRASQPHFLIATCGSAAASTKFNLIRVKWNNISSNGLSNKYSGSKSLSQKSHLITWKLLIKLSFLVRWKVEMREVCARGGEIKGYISLDHRNYNFLCGSLTDMWLWYRKRSDVWLNYMYCTVLAMTRKLIRLFSFGNDFRWPTDLRIAAKAQAKFPMHF